VLIYGNKGWALSVKIRLLFLNLSNRKTKNFSTYVSLSFLLILISFQNCSEPEIELARASEAPEKFIQVKGEFCLPSGFDLRQFVLVNRSILPAEGGYTIDSDEDGLPDSLEIVIGTDPLKKRTDGKYLDSVCFHNTQSGVCDFDESICLNTENELGFSDCDIQALDLYSQPQFPLGYDSDGDGMPDFLELAYNLKLKVDDALLDFDGDGVTNQVEVLQGSHPRLSNSMKPLYWDGLRTNRNPTALSNCSDGDSWSFDADNVKIVNTGFSNTVVIMALAQRPRLNATDYHIQLILLEKDFEELPAQKDSPLPDVFEYVPSDFLEVNPDFFRELGGEL
jgi:hypothetical protein